MEYIRREGGWYARSCTPLHTPHHHFFLIVWVKWNSKPFARYYYYYGMYFVHTYHIILYITSYLDDNFPSAKKKIVSSATYLSTIIHPSIHPSRIIMLTQSKRERPNQKKSWLTFFSLQRFKISALVTADRYRHHRAGIRYHIFISIHRISGFFARFQNKMFSFRWYFFFPPFFHFSHPPLPGPECFFFSKK